MDYEVGRSAYEEAKMAKEELGRNAFYMIPYQILVKMRDKAVERGDYRLVNRIPTDYRQLDDFWLESFADCFDNTDEHWTKVCYSRISSAFIEKHRDKLNPAVIEMAENLYGKLGGKYIINPLLSEDEYNALRERYTADYSNPKLKCKDPDNDCCAK